MAFSPSMDMVTAPLRTTKTPERGSPQWKRAVPLRRETLEAKRSSSEVSSEIWLDMGQRKGRRSVSAVGPIGALWLKSWRRDVMAVTNKPWIGARWRVGLTVRDVRDGIAVD